MAAQKTSVYLTDELKAAVDASGLSLPDLIRRGLAAGEPDPLEDTLRRIVRDEIRTAIAEHTS